MRKIICLLVLAVAITISFGCKFNQLTEEEKQQIAQMESDVKKLEAENTNIEKTLQTETPTRIAQIMQLRSEINKTTIAVLKQHIEGIKAGAPVSIVVEKISPRPDMLPEIEKAMKDKEVDIKVAEREVEKTTAPLPKGFATIRAITEKLLYSQLNQKYLQYKYGLNFPVLGQDSLKEPKIDNNNNNNNNNTAPAATVVKEEEKEPEINDPGPFDLRKVRFGMTKEEVSKRESKKNLIFSEGTGLGYKEKLFALDTTLFYMFHNDKLWRAAYLLEEEHLNKNLYVNDYNEIVSQLKEKYGKPTKEETVWSKNLYRGDASNIGMAYSIGDVTSFAEWEKDDLKIYTEISGDNFKITVKLVYSNIKLEKEYRDAEKKKQSGNI